MAGKKTTMNIAIITGASSGLGREFAIQINEMLVRKQLNGIHELWLIARREERMEELAAKLQVKCKIIVMDITDDRKMEEFSEMLSVVAPHIKMLLNCAGFGLLGKFRQLDIEEQLSMVDLNCKALTKMTYLCIPYMEKRSRIIQLASSAAFLPQPNFAIYAATKSFVLSFSHALSEELRKEGIIVTAVCPGPIRTEFFAIAEKFGANLAVKKLTMVEAPGVVRAALRASLQKRSISVYSPLIKLFHLTAKIVPTKLLLMTVRLFK